MGYKCLTIVVFHISTSMSAIHTPRENKNWTNITNIMNYKDET